MTDARGLPAPAPADRRGVAVDPVARPPEGAAVFILEQGLILWRGREIELTPQEAQLLGLLARRQPHTTTTERLATMVWPAQLPALPESHIRVVICRIRKKIAGLPIEIKARARYGYRLKGAIEVR